VIVRGLREEADGRVQGCIAAVGDRVNTPIDGRGNF